VLRNHDLFMRRFHPSMLLITAIVVAFGLCASPAHASSLSLSPEVSAVLDKIYSFDLEAAAQAAKALQRDKLDHPIGYLLEGEAMWWKTWCLSADYKWGMIDARRRQKQPEDKHYLELATKAYELARAQIERSDSAEMQFFAGMADALAARLYGLRGENRATARYGVRARQSFLRARELDPALADADFGIGLYNYYIDTLSAMAKMLRFFMGIPGGSKQDGLRQLEHAIADGVLTPTIARIYLSLNLHRYDEKYARAIKVLEPVATKYPSNPLFHLMLADLHAKLGHKDKALGIYRAAAALPVADAECRSHIQELVASATATLSLSRKN
jgi:tetratricopeptide (TPR) repeat protein